MARYRREVSFTISPIWLFRVERWVLEWLEHRGIIGEAWRAWPIHWPYRFVTHHGPIVCEGE